MSEHQKKYREKNRESLNRYQREYYKKHRERINEVSRQRAKTHKDDAKERHTKWYCSINGRHKKAKELAKKRNIEFLLTKEEHQNIIKNNICHYCNKPLNKGGSGLDRKNNEPFYKIENVVACCKRCNQTFMNNYNYREKLILAESIKDIDILRLT